MFNQSKAFAIGLLIAVFLAGIALGSAGTRWMAQSRMAAQRAARGGFADRLARELQLTTVQRDSVAAILRRHDPQMRAIFATVRPQMDSLRAQLRTDIRAQLTPEQQTSYQRLMERDRARFSRRDSTAQRGERHNDDD
ncbi:MAG: hypothetical protein AAB409_01020 [Gemmatimonadota bacterium]